MADSRTNSNKKKKEKYTDLMLLSQLEKGPSRESFRESLLRSFRPKSGHKARYCPQTEDVSVSGFRRATTVSSKDKEAKNVKDERGGLCRRLCCLESREKKESSVFYDSIETEQCGVPSTTSPTGLGPSSPCLELSDEPFQEFSLLDFELNKVNKALIDHFSKPCRSSVNTDRIDFFYVSSLLAKGADINTTDAYGQTVLHESARVWHVDVTSWLVKHGADVNKADSYGRTALHVAAACDCVDILKFLINNEANIEALTFGEKQTPVFYAVKYEALDTLEELINSGCKFKLIRDYKGRTPLHLAAEISRPKSVKSLMEFQAPVVVSNDRGEKAITWMIINMDNLAKEALKQFCYTNNRRRVQYFFLHFLEVDPVTDPKHETQTPLEAAVTYRQLDILMDPTMKQLLDVQWKKYGRTWAVLSFLNYFLHVQMWTWLGVLESSTEYMFPSKGVHIALWAFCVSHALLGIGITVMDYVRAKRREKRSTARWRESKMEELQYCHPMWPEERNRLKGGAEGLQQQRKIIYYKDLWYYMDLTCYLALASTLCARLLVSTSDEEHSEIHTRVMSFAIVMLWLNLLQFIRAFAFIGPFVVLLPHILKDSFRFLLMYALLFAPFLAVFWITYGGKRLNHHNPREVVKVPGFETTEDLFFSLLQITVVDEYDFEAMKSVAPHFTKAILAAWIVISSILCLNMFIALLSDTFQRFYDNVQANAFMQRANTILHIWGKLSESRKQQYLLHIKHHCSPLARAKDEDGEHGTSGNEFQKVAFQIKDKLHVLDGTITRMQREGREQVEVLHTMFRGVEKDFGVLEKTLKDLISHSQHQHNLSTDNVAEIVKLLHELSGKNQEEDTFLDLFHVQSERSSARPCNIPTSEPTTTSLASLPTSRLVMPTVELRVSKTSGSFSRITVKPARLRPSKSTSCPHL